MNYPTRFVALAVFTLAVFGCGDSPDSTGDFVLPAGDATAGEAVFLKLRCYDCHRVSGADLPVAEEPNQVLVALGGETTKVVTYGDLLTAIVNPSHRLAPEYTEALIAVDGQSKMTRYNEVMTVSELIDLVAYLQPKYRVKKTVSPSRYPSYNYR